VQRALVITPLRRGFSLVGGRAASQAGRADPVPGAPNRSAEQQPTSNYVLTVNNVRDNSATTNIIAPDSQIGITFNIVSNIFDASQSWRFDTSEGNDRLGLSWIQPNYNDDPSLPPFAWSDGFGVFNFSLNLGLVYCIGSPGSQLSLGPTTFYFRTHFNLSTNFGPHPVLRFRHMIDDGAVFYVNTTPVYSFHMPNGGGNYSTVAQPAVSGNATCITAETNIGSGILLKGANTLAVEVHQASDSDQDVIFGTEFSIINPVIPTLPAESLPTLKIARVSDTVVNIRWTGHGFALEGANNIPGPWVQVPNMATNMNITINKAVQLYRLHKVN
jgi:hypothetical protein